jgi:hypothetical protein
LAGESLRTSAISRSRRAYGDDNSGASPSAASQPLAEVSRAGKKGVDRASEKECKQKVTKSAKRT